MFDKIDKLIWKKIFQIDPTYCSAPRMNNENGIVGAYTGDLGRQTTLIPQQEDKPPLHPKQYSFISSCFFLTHRALHLGVQVREKYLARVHSLTIYQMYLFFIHEK